MSSHQAQLEAEITPQILRTLPGGLGDTFFHRFKPEVVNFPSPYSSLALRDTRQCTRALARARPRVSREARGGEAGVLRREHTSKPSPNTPEHVCASVKTAENARFRYTPVPLLGEKAENGQKY